MLKGSEDLGIVEGVIGFAFAFDVASLQKVLRHWNMEQLCSSWVASLRRATALPEKYHLSTLLGRQVNGNLTKSGLNSWLNDPRQVHDLSAPS